MTVKGLLLTKGDKTEKNAQKTRLIHSRIQVIFFRASVPRLLFFPFFCIPTYFAADFIAVRLSFCPFPFNPVNQFPALHPPSKSDGNGKSQLSFISFLFHAPTLTRSLSFLKPTYKKLQLSYTRYQHIEQCI
jgi:hypothetical protein